MSLRPIFNQKNRPILIAGPCSAETEEQVFETARSLAIQGVDLYRAGIWKPRTRPGAFEGVGAVGLPWLRRVRKELGMQVTTEVATSVHVEQALAHGIDVLWIGARTTVNPFSVQEIADALRGLDVPVLVKNPVNPDLKLWIGAIERLQKAGISRIAAVHRGFSHHSEKTYRNAPLWNLPIELKRQFPELEIICDHSHICGRRDLLLPVAQRAFDLAYNGLMTEVHPHPDEAWSDAEQQVTPTAYADMISMLTFRHPSEAHLEETESLHFLRQQIDDLDAELLQILASRMNLVEKIGVFKKDNNVAVFQPLRWQQVRAQALEGGVRLKLPPEFIQGIFDAIHEASIQRQVNVMK